MEVKSRHSNILFVVWPQKKKGILGKRTRNRQELEVQNLESLKRKEANNEKLIETHKHKMIEHLKLRKRRRFKTVAELQAFFMDKGLVAGLEYSYAEKCKIIREQIQLRKKLDGVTKVGDTKLHNCSDAKAYPEPLTTLWKFFDLMCTREQHHGIPPPIAPELMERRALKPGDDSLATILLKRQHEQTAALAHSFYRLGL